MDVGDDSFEPEAVLILLGGIYDTSTDFVFSHYKEMIVKISSNFIEIKHKSFGNNLWVFLQRTKTRRTFDFYKNIIRPVGRAH